jgi:hypothetical protein
MVSILGKHGVHEMTMTNEQIEQVIERELTSLRARFPVAGMHRKAFFELDPHDRCAKCEAKAAKAGLRPKPVEPIVPENVKPGRKEHLDALSRFFGI